MHMMEERMRRALPLALRRQRVRSAGRLYPEGRLGAARLPRQDHIRGHWHAIRSMPTSTPWGWCATPCASSSSVEASSASLQGGYSPSAIFRMNMQRKADTDDPLALIQYLDIQTYLVG
jgi:asparagine synthase (glutamine-hydrolysing)